MRKIILLDKFYEETIVSHVNRPYSTSMEHFTNWELASLMTIHSPAKKHRLIYQQHQDL